MILPKDVKSRHAIRDSKILTEFIDTDVSQTTLANKYGISQRRVSQILQQNASTVIAKAKDYTKMKRLNFYNAVLSSNIPIAPSKLHAIEAQRKEFEAETQINNVTQYLNVSRPIEPQINPAETRSKESIL